MEDNQVSFCEETVFIPASKEIESFHITVGTKLDKELRQKIKYAQGTFDCAICYSVCNLQHMQIIDTCGHFFCKDCFITNLEYLIEKEGNVLKLRCPCCKIKLPKELIFEVLSDESLRKYKLRTLELEVGLDEEKIFCPFPNCSGVIKGKKSTQDPQKCEECKQKVCFNCRTAEHRSVSCKENQKKSFKAVNIGKGFGQCPSCKVPVEKNEGCPQMYCSRCGCQWCWVCGRFNGSQLHIFTAFLCELLTLSNVNMRSKLKMGFLSILIILASPIFIAVTAIVLAFVLPYESSKKLLQIKFGQPYYMSKMMYFVYILTLFVMILVCFSILLCLFALAFVIFIIPYMIIEFLYLIQLMYHWRHSTIQVEEEEVAGPSEKQQEVREALLA